MPRSWNGCARSSSGPTRHSAGAMMPALLAATGTAGRLHADETFQRYFRLQWEATPGARGPEITGYVENVSDLPVDRMRLLVERLDAGGEVIGSTTT